MEPHKASSVRVLESPVEASAVPVVGWTGRQDRGLESEVRGGVGTPQENCGLRPSDVSAPNTPPRNPALVPFRNFSVGVSVGDFRFLHCLCIIRPQHS